MNEDRFWGEWFAEFPIEPLDDKGQGLPQLLRKAKAKRAGRLRRRSMVACLVFASLTLGIWLGWPLADPNDASIASIAPIHSTNLLNPEEPTGPLGTPIPPTNQPGLITAGTVPSVVVKILTDEELFELIRDHPIAIVGEKGSRKAVFLNPPFRANEQIGTSE